MGFQRRRTVAGGQQQLQLAVECSYQRQTAEELFSLLSQTSGARIQWMTVIFDAKVLSFVRWSLSTLNTLHVHKLRLSCLAFSDEFRSGLPLRLAAFFLLLFLLRKSPNLYFRLFNHILVGFFATIPFTVSLWNFFGHFSWQPSVRTFCQMKIVHCSRMNRRHWE